MLYSNLCANISHIIAATGIDESFDSTPSAPNAGNIGSFIYNLFRFFKSMAMNLRDFFTSNITVFGVNISVWALFASASFITILILVILARFT